jgi:hypothetical protein
MTFIAASCVLRGAVALPRRFCAAQAPAYRPERFADRGYPPGGSADTGAPDDALASEQPGNPSSSKFGRATAPTSRPKR